MAKAFNVVPFVLRACKPAHAPRAVVVPPEHLGAIATALGDLLIRIRCAEAHLFTLADDNSAIAKVQAEHLADLERSLRKMQALIWGIPVTAWTALTLHAAIAANLVGPAAMTAQREDCSEVDFAVAQLIAGVLKMGGALHV